MKKLNKKGVKFEAILIGFVILTLYVFGGTLMMVDLNNNYDTNISTDKYDEVFNTSGEMFDLAEAADNKAFQGDIAEVESADATIRGSYSVIRLISGVYGTFWAVINTVAEEIGIHPILVTAAYIAFVLTIVFSLVYLVFRFIPR